MIRFVLWLLVWGGLSFSWAGGDPLVIADRLAQMNLKYLWGSNDPARGGLDCSGFVQAVFKEAYGLDLPDEAGKQYLYLREHGRIWDGTTRWVEKEIRPGDLVFYSGTHPCERPSPITHVMMIVGSGRVVGSQNIGQRIDLGGIGVGYYGFRMIRPCGRPDGDQAIYRQRPMIYAYGRVYPATVQ